MKFNLTALLLISLIMVSCGGTKEPVTQHEIQPTYEVRVAGETDAHKNPSATATENSFPTRGTKSPLDFLSASKAIYLDIKSWENRTQSIGDHFRNFVDQVHFALLSVKPEERWTELPGFFQNFCSADFQNCKFIDLLYSSPYASELLNTIADSQTDLKLKYYFLLLGFEIKNNSSADKLSISFLKDITAYRKILIEEKNKGLLSKVAGVLKLLLPRVRSGELKTENNSWMDSLNLETSPDTTDNFLSGQVRTENIGGQVKPTSFLAKEMAAQQALSTSYQNRLKWLLQAMPSLSQQLNVAQMDPTVEFYIVDQLMVDRWSPKQAFAFLSGSGADMNLVATLAQKYIKTQIIYILAKSVEEIKKYRTLQNGKVTVKFFDDAKQLLLTNFTTSRALPERIQRIVDLSVMVDPKSEATKNLTLVKANLNQTLKISLNNALTFALINVGQRSGLSPKQLIPLSKYTTEGEVQFGYMITKFWRGHLPPLFDFTEDWDPSTPLQIIESLEFAVKTGLFEMLGSSADEAMTLLLQTYMQTNIVEDFRSGDSPPSRIFYIYDKIRVIDQIRNQEDFKFAINLCKGMETKVAAGVKVLLLSDMTKSPTLGGFVFKLKSSSDTNTLATQPNEASRQTWTYQPVDSRWTDMLEHFRLDSIPYLAQMNAIMTSAEANGAKFTIARKTSDYFRDQMKSFALSYKSFFELAAPCWQKIFELEKNNVLKIAQYEKSYWQWALQKIREGKSDTINIFAAEIPEELDYQTHTIGSPKATEMSLNKFDFLIRARHYVMYGLKEMSLPPIDPTSRITFDPKLKSSSLYKNAGDDVATIGLNGTIDAVATDLTTSGGITKITDWLTIGFQPYGLYKQEVEAATLFYKIAPYLKQNLGVENFYTAEAMLETARSSILSLNTTKNELALLKTMGKKGWFDPFVFVEKIWLMNDSNEPIPYANMSLYQLSLQWMAGYGSKNQWENKDNETAVPRPDNLVPLEVQATKMFYHLVDVKNNRTHLFKDQLSAMKEIENHYRIEIKNDDIQINNLIKVIQTTLKPIDVQFQTNRPVEHYEAYDTNLINNLQAVTEQLHVVTGGIFRN